MWRRNTLQKFNSGKNEKKRLVFWQHYLRRGAVCVEVRLDKKSRGSGEEGRRK